jgi:hypothetical protein
MNLTIKFDFQIQIRFEYDSKCLFSFLCDIPDIFKFTTPDLNQVKSTIPREAFT